MLLSQVWLKYKLYILTAGISVANFWFFRIFRHSISLSLLLIPATLITINLLRRFSLSLFITFLLINLIFLLFTNIDSRIFIPSGPDISRINHYRQFYPGSLGRLFHNKLSLAANQISANLFANLDLNLYFFANHPRQRPGISEFAKLSPILLPLFIYGLLHQFRRPSYGFILVSLAVFSFSAIANPASYFGPIFVLPLINAVILNSLCPTKLN